MGIAHSEYLQYAAEVGLPTALLLVAMAAYLFNRAARNASLAGVTDRAIQEAAILSAAGIGSHALIDNNWTVPVMAAGLVVFSLADSLPRRKWGLNLVFPRRAAVAGLIMAGLMLYMHSTFIPWLGLHFIHAGHRERLAGNLEAAESLSRMGVAVIPDHPGFLDTTGTLYLDMYKSTREEKYLEFADHFLASANAAAPNADEPRRHLEMALIERLTGNPLDDILVHRRIAEVDRDLLRIDPFDPFIRRNLAEALHNSGFAEEAEQELTHTIEIEPNFVPGYLRLAEWCELRGDTDRARSLRERAEAITALFENVEATERYEALLLGRMDPALKQAEMIR
jgi:tetratricopeptide (TPR) repeat protein